MTSFGGRGGQRAHPNFWLFCALLMLVFLLGGASRADALSQPVLRVACVVALAIWAMQLHRDQFRATRAPWLFLAAPALLIVIQLVPLPPGLWAALPGHAIFVEGMKTAGIEPTWRPLSLTPDRSLDSLLSLLPPVAAVAGL